MASGCPGGRAPTPRPPYRFIDKASKIRWLMQYLGRVTDAQIRAGLRASGATRHEQDCFTGALRARIRQLHQVSHVNYRARTR